MSASHHDLVHLAALIEAAKAQAEKLGAPAHGIMDILDDALDSTRTLEAQGGEPDEGVRTEDLTTENDR